MTEPLQVDVDGFRPGRRLFGHLLQQAGLAGTARREEQDVFGIQTSLEGGDHIVAREEIIARDGSAKDESHGIGHRVIL
ncbi:MAG: hypothetical protein MZW92_26805 [Comamonadaceae bacterium]|nr:hypothetical protein [Comamonadaceae bacterium]